jgi:hypothetical protein
LTSSGINQAQLNTCIASATTQFNITKTADATIAAGSYPPFNIDKTLNQQYGVQGSPTLIINGVEASSGRDSQSYLNTICSAFNTKPSECSQTLSSTTPDPGFGSTTSSTTGAATSGSCS